MKTSCLLAMLHVLCVLVGVEDMASMNVAKAMERAGVQYTGKV